MRSVGRSSVASAHLKSAHTLKETPQIPGPKRPGVFVGSPPATAITKIRTYFAATASAGFAGGMIVSLMAWIKKIFFGDLSLSCCTFSSAASR